MKGLQLQRGGARELIINDPLIAQDNNIHAAVVGGKGGGVACES